ncbi:MAG: hypothetical protein HY062_01700 [Bacteroidetes bacterium]|nr:hypothetical protein [Bacteroidota bacterium]
MKKFEFDITITAPTQSDAMEKMKAINAIGKHLTLSELQTLAETVKSPTLLAIAKQKLGL